MLSPLWGVGWGGGHKINNSFCNKRVLVQKRDGFFSSQLNISAERTLSTGCLSAALTGENFTVMSKSIQVEGG